MMRYRFMDRMVSIEANGTPARIEVVKIFDAQDDAFSGPAGLETVPNSLVLELLATTGGYLIFRRLDRSRLPLLVKVSDAHFQLPALAGTSLHARAELRGLSDLRDDVVMAEASAEVLDGDRRLAWGRLLYACVTVPNVDLRELGNSA